MSAATIDPSQNCFNHCIDALKNPTKMSKSQKIAASILAGSMIGAGVYSISYWVVGLIAIVSLKVAVVAALTVAVAVGLILVCLKPASEKIEDVRDSVLTAMRNQYQNAPPSTKQKKKETLLERLNQRLAYLTAHQKEPIKYPLQAKGTIEPVGKQIQKIQAEICKLNS